MEEYTTYVRTTGRRELRRNDAGKGKGDSRAEQSRAMNECPLG